MTTRPLLWRHFPGGRFNIGYASNRQKNILKQQNERSYILGVTIRFQHLNPLDKPAALMSFRLAHTHSLLDPKRGHQE